MSSSVPNSYQRLPGTGFRRQAPPWVILLLFFVIGIFALLLRGRQVRMYLGDDHLLTVDWDGAKEYYKRFRYEDIQALTIRRTHEARLLNAVLGCLAGLLFVLALVAAGERGLMWFLIVLGSVAVLGLTINLILGPSCQCHLQTAVQNEELVSLGRLKRAQQALGRLQERISAVQGTLAAEEIPVRNQELQAALAARYVVDDPSAPPRML